MQRLFTMFPGGAAGVALLLLRIGVTASLWQASLGSGVWPMGLYLFGLYAVSASLLTGFATPAVSVISWVLLLIKIVDPLKQGLGASPEVVTTSIQCISAIALSLLGPGAFSIDARLFGRRVLSSS